MKMVATIVIFIVITILIIMYQALCCGLGTQSTMMKRKKKTIRGLVSQNLQTSGSLNIHQI